MSQQKIIIITAPSGSGKTTLVKRLMLQFPTLAFSISACTRTPRGGEVDGTDYHFISLQQFEQSIAQNNFLEWEMVYEGKYYGTLKSELNRIWQNHKIPLVDIDVKGALKVQEQYKAQALSVFIKAPSIDILSERLQKRGTEPPESLKERIDKAAYELSFASKFDHTIVNDDLGKASAELSKIVSQYLTQ
ncbi:MAG: guanylate kinase [Phycisphaerales bacterium]|nr:guanylate kinase [Phycisphaerales bacterium]